MDTLQMPCFSCFGFSSRNLEDEKPHCMACNSEGTKKAQDYWSKELEEL